MGTTNRLKWRTPEDADVVRQGAAAMRTLGADIDAATVLGNEWISMTGGSVTSGVASGAWRTVSFDTATLTGSATKQALGNVDPAGVIIPDNRAGLYLCLFSVSWAAGTGGRRNIGPANAQNVAVSALYQAYVPAPTPSGTVVQTAAFGWLQGGPAARICLNIYQESGATLGITDARYTVYRAGQTL